MTVQKFVHGRVQAQAKPLEILRMMHFDGHVHVSGYGKYAHCRCEDPTF